MGIVFFFNFSSCQLNIYCFEIGDVKGNRLDRRQAESGDGGKYKIKHCNFPQLFLSHILHYCPRDKIVQNTYNILVQH